MKPIPCPVPVTPALKAWAYAMVARALGNRPLTRRWLEQQAVTWDVRATRQAKQADLDEPRDPYLGPEDFTA